MPTPPPPDQLTPELMSRFATIALGHVTREYPNKLDHVLSGPDDLQSPSALHPIFYGSFDWHSCVHGYWLLSVILRRCPDLPVAREIEALFAAQLTENKVRGEIAYLARPGTGMFERPYGWAWLLKLAADLAQHRSAQGREWSANLAPLAQAFARRFSAFLPKATYPTRAGTHANSAFALRLALDYADMMDAPLAASLRAKAEGWYGEDRDCQAWEPGGEDFLSPALIEAECMRRVLTPDAFLSWLDRFLPRLARGEPASLFEPARVSDHTDGKIGHLDGLNLSRAWCWQGLAASLPASDPRGIVAREAAAEHLAHGLPHISGDYLVEHWLASFALLALDAGEVGAS
jgi:hypothetical protein